MKNNLHITLGILLKTSVFAMATATILASGTTDAANGSDGDSGGSGAKEISALHVTGIRDEANNSGSAGKNTLTFLIDGENITMKRAGKTYNFTASDLTTKDGKKDYNITVGDETVNVQNISTEFLQSSKSYTTNSVDLWFANIGNSTNNTTEQGYFVIGNKSTTLPGSGTTTFKGGMTGYLVEKSGEDELFILGDSELSVNFTTKKISGGMTNIRDANSETFGADIEITDGILTSDGFSGSLKFSNAAPIISSEVSGNFYGGDASELGGVGQIESSDSVLSFGFTAKK